MTSTIPERPEPEADAQLELACALYTSGKIDKVSGAQLANVDFFTFQRALGERGIFSYSEDMLEQDVQTLHELFPR
jgi:predicted HTH domain antitoxin